MESVDKTLFTLNHGKAVLLTLVSGFQEMMEKEFQMPMIGELTFFLRYPSKANEAR
jgi:hypothetical protein